MHIWRLQAPALTVLKGRIRGYRESLESSSENSPKNSLENGIVWGARWRPGSDKPRQILSVSGNGSLKLWNESGKLLKAIALPQQTLHSVDWHPDGTRFAIACSDYSVQIRQADGELTQTLLGHGDMVWQTRYSPDGKQLASVSSDTPHACGLSKESC